MPEPESSTEHVHEWSAGSGNGYSYENGAFCLPCRAYIDWDFQEVVRRYQAHDALVAALEDLEWMAVDGVPRCPSCWGWQGDGDHKDDCHLVAALRLAKGEAS